MKKVIKKVLKKNKPDYQFWFLVCIIHILLCIFALKSFSSDVKMIRLSEASIAKIFVSTRGTVLSFPTKPTKVILSRANSFGIEYVENDLAISPLSYSSRSNLFVYLLGRRFAFDLVASTDQGSAVIQVRDAIENKKKEEKR